MSINKELLKNWIKALRSGKYEQGKYVLRNGKNEYCCLGVLCDLVLKDKWVFAHEQNIYNIKLVSDKGFNVIYDGSFPKEIWTQNFDIINQGKLQKMNDRDEKSFNEIADYLESFL